MRVAWLALVCAGLTSGCFGEGGEKAAAPAPAPAPEPSPGPAPSPSPAPGAPLHRGDWAFWGAEQGLSDDVQDVSADEAGNVYVAGGSALFAKGPADAAFTRFDAENAGLTRGCNDRSEYFNETPARAMYQCRVLAVAGAGPGKAIVGFDAFSAEPQTGARWTYHAGGADVVAFDAAARTMTRTRHVWIASPPHTICTKPVYGRTTSCDPSDYWWNAGRRVMTSIRRIVVNHDPTSPLYGDAWIGGHHGTLSALLANAAARGYPDRTSAWGPEWADARDTWEHEHPNVVTADGFFVNGEGWGLSLHPRTGVPWGSNEYRVTHLEGPYGASLANDDWWQHHPFYDPWPDPLFAPTGTYRPENPNIRSLSHCPDGSLWIGSLTHGLAVLDPDAATTLTYPNGAGTGGGVSAVACDPTDGSVWIGLWQGGVARLRQGVFERIDTTGWPEFALRAAVQSIQIDRWSPRRTVYFAFPPSTDGSGTLLAPGGIAAYGGP